MQTIPLSSPANPHAPRKVKSVIGSGNRIKLVEKYRSWPDSIHSSLVDLVDDEEQKPMTQAKKALLVGSSFSAVPIYFELKRRGLHVTVCGNIREDPCHQYADASIYADYSDKESLLKIVEERVFDFIVPTCNDYSYMSTSWVAYKLGFPGFDTPQITHTIHTKKLFRQFTQSNRLRAPKLYEIDSVEYVDIDFPCLVKPIDAFSGRGVSKVYRRIDLEVAVHAAKTSSREGECVVEQYVDGTLHSHSAFVQDGRIFTDFFVDEYCTTHPFQVNCSNHPSGLREEIKDAVRREMETLITHLAISDGLMHTQFISNGSDFWIIECMRRCPGDLYGQLIERSTGINYTGMYVVPFLGQRYPRLPSRTHNHPYGRHTISTDTSLVYFSFTHAIPAKDVEIIQLKASGEILAPAPQDKLAILIFPFDNREIMLDMTSRLAQFVAIQCPGDPPWST